MDFVHCLPRGVGTFSSFKIAATRRMLYREGCDSNVGGHVSARAIGEDAFWATGFEYFDQTRPDGVAKLDMSLIRGIDGAERKRRVVRSLIHLCQEELGVAVVCEGIETEAERDVLVDLGADLLQGYLFARPASGFPTPTPGSLPPGAVAAPSP